MTGHELSEYRRRLLNLRRRLGGTVHDLRDDRSGGEPSETRTDTADLGGHRYEEQIDLAVAGTEEQLLGEVGAALARIELGTFGRCTACERPVGEERLRTLPYSRLCAACARQKETARR